MENVALPAEEVSTALPVNEGESGDAEELPGLPALDMSGDVQEEPEP